jgi:hypothetical protein
MWFICIRAVCFIVILFVFALVLVTLTSTASVIGNGASKHVCPPNPLHPEIVHV